MPNSNEIERRNKAMISLCLLTTPRISALQSATIGSIKYLRDLEVWAFMQNPNLVFTKFAKNITSYFIGHLENIHDNVIKWREYLQNKGFKDNDPLFPRMVASFNKQNEHILLLEKKIIKSQSAVREIFKKAFRDNNMPYHKPHSFRHSMTRRMMRDSRSSLLLSALNTNIGHEYNKDVLIGSYVQLQIMRELGY